MPAFGKDYEEPPPMMASGRRPRPPCVAAGATVGRPRWGLEAGERASDPSPILPVFRSVRGGGSRAASGIRGAITAGFARIDRFYMGGARLCRRRVFKGPHGTFRSAFSPLPVSYHPPGHNLRYGMTDEVWKSSDNFAKYGSQILRPSDSVRFRTLIFSCVQARCGRTT